MAKIVQLSPHVADLIAAGEVVERPASVIKELVENSIDAGAKNVTVEIQNGGMTFIRITDDGCGMEPEDAETAFLRHATSKIRSKEDLESIHTLGFRGEALAATAAVSKIDVMTRTAEADAGVSLHLEAGKILQREPVGCPVGTTMIIRGLFYNTPARMKFMKSDSAEASAAFAAVQKQAMAHPEVSVRFLRDGEELLHTPGDGALLSAVYSVLGRQTALDMIPVDSQWEKVRLTGYCSRPTATRGNRSRQIFFVNGRYVQSRMMAAALEEAYRNQIMVGRFPACVLCIQLPVTAVDVNVHPAKTEVKFLNEREIFDSIHYGVLAALNKTSGKVGMTLPQTPKREEQELPARQTSGKTGGALPGNPEKPAAKTPRPRQDFYRTMDAGEYQQFLTGLRKEKNAEPSQAVLKAVFDVPGEKPAAQVRSQVAIPGGARPEPSRQSVQTPKQPPVNPAQTSGQQPVQKPETAPEQTPYRIVGEVLDTYIIVEQGDTVLFMDKHAAHERILFEKLLQQEQQAMGQLLLSPVRCDLDTQEAAALAENRSLLLTLGYDMDDLGDGSVLVRQVPADMDAEDAQANLEEIAAHLRNGRKDTPQTMRQTLLHSIACKAAIKAGSRTDPQERALLVRQVMTRDDLKYCPHGRPICVTLTRHQLEKQFKRV